MLLGGLVLLLKSIERFGLVCLFVCFPSFFPFGKIFEDCKRNSSIPENSFTWKSLGHFKNTFFKAINKENNEVIETGKKLFNPQYIVVQKLAQKKNKLQNKTRKNKEINADEDAEAGEPLFTIGETINLCTQY